MNNRPLRPSDRSKCISDIPHLWDPVEVVFHRFWLNQGVLNPKTKALYIIEVCKNCSKVRIRDADKTYVEVKEV